MENVEITYILFIYVSKMKWKKKNTKSFHNNGNSHDNKKKQENKRLK